MPLQKLREKIEAAGLDALLVTQAENRRYLSGFTGSAGVLLITPTRQLLLTDSRYYEQVRREAPDWELVEAGYQTFRRLAELLPELELGGAKIGFEADDVTVARFRAMQEALDGVNLVETDGLVAGLRAVKSADELDAIRKAVALADETMAHLYEWIQPGMTEKEVAWELEVYMRTRGASALSFEAIVAAGPNSALPHATPSDAVIQPGDVVLVDMGCVVGGYCSDLTRTFSLGEPRAPQFEAVWGLVEQACAAAEAGIRAGMSGKAADALARDVIAAAGHGDHFGHSLGHGVGLAIHEMPRLSYAAEDPLPEGAVVTIEPGVYLPGEFGVRLEDMAVVTAGGMEVLTRVPKVKSVPR
ncbi:MAG: aminopeptidase P family protein [Caldilineae bacterium]|nr:MAG: aminopeptidase P family protein [Caldilineae bacterium]